MSKRCVECNEKLEEMYVVNEEAHAFTFATKSTVFYCDNDECPKFGLLTLAAKKEEGQSPKQEGEKKE